MSRTPPSATPSAETLAVIPPVMTILSDHPILRDASELANSTDREDDAFELDSRLGAVYDIIRHKNTRAPLAVGIFGDWGTGKSSAMRWLANQLDTWSKDGVERKGHCRCRTVWFEPWKYQTRDEVWRGLIAEVVINSIDPKKATVATVVSAAKKFGGALGRWFIHAVSSLEVSGGVPGVGEASVNLEALAKIAEDYKQTTHPEKAYLNEFESTLKAWVKDSLAKDERMVLFIDDLDRCLPAVVLEVLEALKLYLNIPQLVFVIGLDRDVVKAIVRKHYREAELPETKADSYLDKMFQVEVEVPPSERRMDGYLDAQILLLDKTTEGYWSRSLNDSKTNAKEVIEGVIKQLAQHNPREVKRLLNSTLLGGSAAARGGGDEKTKYLRFAQGCQAYLIARILRDDPNRPASILREVKTWEFLQVWSQFIKDFPLAAEARADSVAGRANDDNQNVAEIMVRMAHDEAADNAWKIVTSFEPRSRSGKRGSLLMTEVPLLWELLNIPCSADVGQTMAARAAQLAASADAAIASTAVAPAATIPAATPAPAAPQDPLAGLPLLVRTRIANAFTVAVESLTTAQLAYVATLDLSGGEIDDQDIQALVAKSSPLTALTTLSLYDTRITDQGLAFLTAKDSPLTAVTELHLGGTQITDQGLAHLAAKDSPFTALTALSLAFTKISDQGLAHLAAKNSPLIALTALDLNRTQITDQGLAYLAAKDSPLTALTTLYLRNTQITDHGIGAVKRRFPKIQIIK
jgi:hypothetical protein